MSRNLCVIGMDVSGKIPVKIEESFQLINSKKVAKRLITHKFIYIPIDDIMEIEPYTHKTVIHLKYGSIIALENYLTLTKKWNEMLKTVKKKSN